MYQTLSVATLILASWALTYFPVDKLVYETRREVQEKEIIELFNGQDLDQWFIETNDSVNVDMSSLFSVEDGAIHVYKHQKNRSTQPFAGLFTKEEFSNYKLHLEYKWGSKKFRPRHNFVRDAGVVIHQHRAPTIWPYGIECQIQEGDTGDLWIIGARASSKVNEVIRNYDPNGTLETKGNTEQKFHRFPRGYFWEHPGWNKIELVVKGDDAEFWVNGHLVNEALDMKSWNATEEKWQPLTKGRIMIQAEGAELFYRNILLEML